MSKYSPGMPQIALSPLIRSGLCLMRAGRWDDATQLLAAAQAETPEERLALAAALAEIAVDQDFAQQTDNASPELAVLAEALAETPDACTGWDFAFLQLRKDYGTALIASARDAGDELFDARDSGAELAARVRELSETAPDEGRSGHAWFYAGVIADNLLERPTDAFAAFKTALDLGERACDDLLVSLALRHLGDHAHTAGDLALARIRWERSTELRQKVGHLLGALAQQTLLAVLARDEGNLAASKALATEVNRWSRQAGIPWLQAQSADLMS
jgi:tetratricopeptide (TPR) repeat protein